jgi:malic enzyme
MDALTLRKIMEQSRGLLKIEPKVKATDPYSLSLIYTPGVINDITNSRSVKTASSSRISMSCFMITASLATLLFSSLMAQVLEL